MLSFFRQKGVSSFVYGLIILGMVLVFIVGFSPSSGKKLGSVSEACAARVQGSCIEPKAHKAAFRLVFSRGTGGMRQSVASQVVLEGLIERELLASEANRLGLTVSEDEITDSIYHGNILVSLPAADPNLMQRVGFDQGRAHVDFFKNKETKQFDLKTYERNVKQMTGRSPAEFRDWQSRELLAMKMRDLVRAPVRVADEEAFDRYQTERTTSTIGYTVIRKNWVEKYAVDPAPKEFEAWSKDKANLGAVKTSVRHILIGTRDPAAGPGQPPKPEKVAEAKKKAEGILERAKKGEDFAKLAKEFSEDPGSKDKGGQYGAEMVPRFVQPFQDAYNKLAPGEITPGLVETDFGFHIIKKDDASKDEILHVFKESKATDLSKTIAANVEKSMKSGKSGDDAVKGAIAEYGKYKPLPETAKAEKADGGAVSTTSAKLDGGVPDAAMAMADAAAPAPIAPPMTADTDPERPQFLTSSAFNRGGDPIPAISGEAGESVVKFAFGAKPNDVSDPIKTDDGFIIVTLKEQKPATRPDFDKERDAYVAALVRSKQDEALAYYVKRLRESSKEDVKIDKSNVFGAQSDAGAAREDEDEP